MQRIKIIGQTIGSIFIAFLDAVGIEKSGTKH